MRTLLRLVVTTAAALAASGCKAPAVDESATGTTGPFMHRPDSQNAGTDPVDSRTFLDTTKGPS